jgi:hypothetical protein
VLKTTEDEGTQFPEDLISVNKLVVIKDPSVVQFPPNSILAFTQTWLNIQCIGNNILLKRSYLVFMKNLHAIKYENEFKFS